MDSLDRIINWISWTHLHQWAYFIPPYIMLACIALLSFLGPKCFYARSWLKKKCYPHKSKLHCLTFTSITKLHHIVVHFSTNIHTLIYIHTNWLFIWIPRKKSNIDQFSLLNVWIQGNDYCINSDHLRLRVIIPDTSQKSDTNRQVFTRFLGMCSRKHE